MHIRANIFGLVAGYLGWDLNRLTIVGEVQLILSLSNDQGVILDCSGGKGVNNNSKGNKAESSHYKFYILKTYFFSNEIPLGLFLIDFLLNGEMLI